VRRYGYPVLLFAWVPVVGDAFPLAAGWLRFEPWRSALLLAIGKLVRYLVLAGAWTWFFGA
jgi:membrane protein YqaA with SNARE-associated domain